MKYLRLTILISGFLLLAAFAGVKTINAVDYSPTVNGAINTVSASCSFAGTIDGVDYGTGTTNTAILEPETGVTITVSAGQTLAVGSIDLAGDGSFVIINTGQIKLNAPLYVTDADADGYPANTTLYISSASGRVRRNSLASLAVDCNDAQTCVDGTYPATCKKCNSGCIVNEANGSTGYNCTAIHYRCDGGGGCTAPIVESGCVGAASGHDANWKCITYLGYDMCLRSYGYADVCGGGCYSCQAAQQGCDVPFYSAVCANYVYD